MKTRICRPLIAILLGIAICAVPAGQAWAQGKDVDRIAPDALKKMLDDPKTKVIDVRLTKDKEESNERVKGAHLEDPKNLNAWMSKYSKDHTLIFYCA